MVKLSALATKRSSTVYKHFRALALKKRGVLHVPWRDVMALRLRRGRLRTRIKKHVRMISIICAAFYAWDKRIDKGLIEGVSTNPLWLRRIQRARARVQATSVRREKWHTQEEVRRKVCCNTARQVVTHTERIYHECRACNLGVMSRDCDCTRYDKVTTTYTCNVCGDIYKQRPFPPDIQRPDRRRSSRSDVLRIETRLKVQFPLLCRRIMHVRGVIQRDTNHLRELSRGFLPLHHSEIPFWQIPNKRLGETVASYARDVTL